MYTPAHFNESDPATLFTLIERYSFATLISNTGTEPFASHLPLLVDRNAGRHGTLIGHMARANPQWQHTDNQTVLAIFAGPHAYISPTWYESANVVPTWNYAAIHVYGTFRAIHDDQQLLKIVHDTVNLYEAAMPTPWKMDTGSDFNQKLVKAIVGFNIQITRIEGKLKLNQNHTPDRRETVIRALEKSPDQNAREIADLMAATLKGKP
jgi:transcriptional regulator